MEYSDRHIYGSYYGEWALFLHVCHDLEDDMLDMLECTFTPSIHVNERQGGMKLQ